MANYNETATDTGLTQSETLVTNFAPVISDTGLTQTDSPALITSRGIADTLTFSDYTARFSLYGIADTGLTQTDSFHRIVHRKKTDTGTTITDVFVRRNYRFTSDTGATITDSMSGGVVPAPRSPFDFLCSRNWIVAETPSKWGINAYARFTYTTIAD